jgi:hypothetical protein
VSSLPRGCRSSSSSPINFRRDNRSSDTRVCRYEKARRPIDLLPEFRTNLSKISHCGKGEEHVAEPAQRGADDWRFEATGGGTEGGGRGAGNARVLRCEWGRWNAVAHPSPPLERYNVPQFSWLERHLHSELSLARRPVTEGAGPEADQVGARCGTVSRRAV